MSAARRDKEAGFDGVDIFAAYKAVVKNALVTAESRIKTPENAEEVLSSGQADMVSIVRGQIADPHWANKAKEDRRDSIRPCISCSQGRIRLLSALVQNRQQPGSSEYMLIATDYREFLRKMSAPCMMGDTTRERLDRFGIEVLLATSLESWTNDSATLVNLYSGEKEEREFETLVLATTSTSNNELFKSLGNTDIDVFSIGDAVAARTAHMAIYAARKLALTL